MEWRRLDGVGLVARQATAACGFVALVAIWALVPLPAAAQATATSQVRTEILDPVTAGIDGNMHFGEIVPSAGAGTVVLTPSATPTCTASPSLVRSGVCQAAEFSGSAFTGAQLRVRRPMPNSITLTAPGGTTMTVTNFTLGSTAPTVYLGNPGNSPNHRFRVDAPDGSYSFYVGGTLNVGANQSPGLYQGTFEIDITFN